MSIALRTKLRSLSAAHLLRSFSSSIDDGLGQPPEPIPDRPLRKQSSYPSPPSPRIPNHNRGRKIDTQHSSRGETDADFLERFKLGFEPVVENPKTQPEKSDNIEEQPLSPPGDADEIFKKMKETGLIPNAVAMLDGLCKDGLVQDAMKLFGLMREKGTIPEVVVYTAVVEGFCKAHKFDDAIRIFKKMQSNGVVPNAFSYQVLIRGLCSGKRLDDACAFTIGMLEAGHSPNLATFTGLVDGYCRERGAEDARKVFDEMRVKGFFVEEKQMREYLDKNGPFLPLVWEAILGKKKASKRSLF
ncbi:pentatricopeptide repeat-containing protein at4g38150 [Phtheirospermum japonicum]|uniref:Pentatricopeptide repeat-containing protein at4g38150 n=1 Tax=Phtheirospermum japonicum TaxID=374723 RepID=A0A830CHC4_9LAMI|nr:pentatricopeptide repeat-containing protein at4g38150 [Phtheirospermum japonicum]